MLFSVLCLLGVGLCLALTIDAPRIGTSAALASRAGRLLVGIFAFLVCARLPLDRLRPYLVPLFLAVLVMTALPLVLGPGTKGARRWIQVGPLSFQPVEILKPVFLLVTAELLVRTEVQRRSFRHGVLPVLLPAIAAALILGLQPDVGHAAFLMGLLCVLLLLGGVRMTHLLGMSAAAGAGLALLMSVHGHTQRRLSQFFADQPGFQIQRALDAMAEGSALGVGPGAGWYKMGFVPEARNDFILAILGNEFGVLGSLLVLGAFLLFFVSSMRIAARAASAWDRLVAGGIATMLVFQVGLNVLGVTHTIPEKGIDLPLLSSGGTNLVFALASIGILTNIATRASAAEHGGEAGQYS